MRVLTGGMTNAVFRCSKPSGDNQTVLLRSYGKGTEVILYILHTADEGTTAARG